jgi:O-antigen biosynthesis protein
MLERIRRTLQFRREQGNRQLAVLFLRKLQTIVEGRPVFNPLGAPGQGALPIASNPSPIGTTLALENTRFPNLRPLRTFRVPAEQRRLTMVTDSISKGSLFGGVGTAILLAAQTANRMNARLRIVTRNDPPDAENVHCVLQVYGITLNQEPQLQFASVGDERTEIDLQDGELFITTSWWTTWSTLAGVPAESIIYLLQEDERMFYPYGDDRLRCEQILSRHDLRFVINTKLLWDHLVASGLDNIRGRAIWFEPAFPRSVFYPRPRPQGMHKKRLFFYARPNNLRNLFYLGLKTLDRAIASGALPADEWEILLVGSHIPDVSFGSEVSVQKLENLSWSEYAGLCGSVDLALSLMYTPHPSYPPLDLAASGAIVVTNRFPGKQDLSGYSPNILCADPDVAALVDALIEGTRRVSSKRSGDDGLLRDWGQALAHVVDAVSATEA